MKDSKSAETVSCTQPPHERHLSTGLDDLLISRTVSQGGYDSDARGIRTPSWRKASAGSVLVSPEYTAKILNDFDTVPSQISPSPPQTPRNIGENGHSPTSVSRRPSITATYPTGPEDVQPIEGSRHQIKGRATSTPKKPSTPQRESFSAFLQLRPQESPTDVLRRLSVGLANGTVKLPDTPELKAMRMPSIVQALPEWRLSFAAPKRASSLHRGDHDVQQALKVLSDRVDKVKNSADSDWISTDRHVSLLSNLEPALSQYTNHYGDEKQGGQLHGASQEVGIGGKNEESLEEASDLEMIAHAAASGVHGTFSARTNPAEHKADASPSEEQSQHCNAGLDSEGSVHLFDMRISQRLASTSVIPTVSPSRTNLHSDQYHKDTSFQGSGKLGRFPTFAAQTSAEHVRKPSDPSTRRLFEPDSPVDGWKLHPKWKSRRSMSSSELEQLPHGPELRRDDASSEYMIDATPEASGLTGVTPARPRSKSGASPNGIEIADRPGVLGGSTDQQRNCMGQMTSTNGRGEIDPARLVSNVKGKESKFSEDFAIHKTMTKKVVSEGDNTFSNESMSMLDPLSITQRVVDPDERMSEVDFVGALNEKLNSSVRIQHERDDQGRSASETGTSNSPLAGDSTTQLAPININPVDGPARAQFRGRDECATDMWERALRTAQEDRRFGDSFGQLGPDDSGIRRPSDSRPFHGHTAVEGHISILSFNAGAPPRPYRRSFNLDCHQSLCVEAKQPLTRTTSRARTVKPKKRSLLDIRRLTAAGDPKNHNTGMSSPAAVAPVRDFLSWAHFPSHNRHERSGAAGDKDGVLTRDFSPPTDTETSSSRNRSKLSLKTQPDDMGVDTPGSWRVLKFGHGRKKSRSMNFAISSLAEREEGGEKMRKKSSMLTLMASWRGRYFGHSSDLRRFRAGHRSSVSMEGKVEYPELEIVPGYDGEHGSGIRSEETGKFDQENRKCKGQSGRRRPKTGLGRPMEKENGGDLGKRSIEAEAEAEADVEVRHMTNDVVLPEWWKGRGGPSARAKMDEQTPTEQRRGTVAEVEIENAWAEVYQACVVKDEDNLDQRSIGPGGRHVSPDRSTTAMKIARQVSEPHEGDGEGEDSYVSCSISLNEDLTDLIRRSTDQAVDTDRWFPAGRKMSDHEHHGEGGHKLLPSSELRDSTVNFRLQLQEEERRVRESLLERGQDEVDGGRC